MTTYTIPEGPAPLYNQYPGQCQPQPAYVSLDEDGTVSVDWSGEIGNAVPASVWHGRDVRLSISPYASSAGIRRLFDDSEFRALVDQYYAGHSVEWRNGNNVGRLTDDARDALDKLERFADEWFREPDHLDNVCSAGEWLSGADLSDYADLIAAGDWDAIDERITADAAADGFALSDSPSDYVRECAE